MPEIPPTMGPGPGLTTPVRSQAGSSIRSSTPVTPPSGNVRAVGAGTAVPARSGSAAALRSDAGGSRFTAPGRPVANTPSSSPVNTRRPGSTSQTARARARAGVMIELLDVARQHIATHGAAGLSLRAVARDLGMTSSAVYRYVANRNHLLTILISQSYAAVADVAESADRGTAAAGGDAGRRWLAVCRAVRAWAFAHPHEYALIYGSPVPGYDAPPNTIPDVVRLWRVIIAIIDTAISTGSLRPPPNPFDVTGLITPEALALGGGEPVPPFEDSGVRTLALFTSLIGTISAQLFGHFYRVSDLPDRLFDLTIATAAEGVGLDLPVYEGDLDPGAT